ncbi:MAG: hypothetical protein K0S04_409 [Herbinix sp.]|jgi:membrane protease YdiL (CAAX protease family)|nr:hypothetical protein [Herbinix sp.]
MKKYLKGMVAIMPPLAAIAVQLIAITVLTMANTIISRPLTEEVNYLFSALAVMSSGFVFIFWYRIEVFGEIRGKLTHVLKINNIYKFVCLALGCQLFVSGILSILTEYFPKAFNEYGNTISTILSGSPIVVVLVTVIVAPITEELIFRGVTLHMANRYVPFLIANILQAVLFGIYHGNFVQGIYAAGLGFILGLINQKFQTIYAPILLHMMVNASAFLMMLLPESTFSYYFMLIIGFILIITAIIAIKPMNVLKLQNILIITKYQDKEL